VNLAKAVLVAFALVTTIGYSQASIAKFPGKISKVISPDGRYILRNVDNLKEPYHSIFLEDKKTGAKRKVYDYGRSVAIVWAPNSKLFAINDYAGSNLADTYILSVEQPIPTIDVQKEITRKVSSFQQHKWDHDYFGVSRWIDDRRVSVYFWGHGGSPSTEFCECYVYTLNGSVQKCVKQPSGADLEQRCSNLTP
jgi:hypothetical protein